MKILQIYNQQRGTYDGTTAVVEATIRILSSNGHEPRLVMKSSRSLEGSLTRKFNAFWGGIYNFRSYYQMRLLIREERPDVAHVHSLYPMFSPSILRACKSERVPVVMTVHNWILTCPTWCHLYNGKVCEACTHGHEYRCILKNCRRNMPESIAYGLRSMAATWLRLFHDNVDRFLVLTPFGQEKLLAAGYHQDQIAIVPNPVCVPESCATPSKGRYVAFAGRLSPEKGLDILLAAARAEPAITFKIAGSGPILAQARANAPKNVEFLGRLEPEALPEFYRKARVVVVPSTWYEGFGLVAADAMALGLPVIASRIGGLSNVVDDQVTGLLFEPRNVSQLRRHVRDIWHHPEIADRMGSAARQKVIREYSEDAYFSNLMAVYQSASQRQNCSAC